MPALVLATHLWLALLAVVCCIAAGTASAAVVHFLGGAFVGAAPQLSYRLLLEGLAARGVLVSGGGVGAGAGSSEQQDVDHHCFSVSADVIVFAGVGAFLLLHLSRLPLCGNRKLANHVSMHSSFFVCR
eukprot:GHRQ01019636.1.p2 GENE.GHRQ01019636.1~~GHRQ01019636.1.p2  ORF type:complete len:129 (+),score=21.37 GHRQ01019636.1:359-745(+)